VPVAKFGLRDSVDNIGDLSIRLSGQDPVKKNANS
jgi:hypothetical protein